MKRLLFLLSIVSFFLSGKAQPDSISSFSNDSVSIRTSDLVNDLVTLQLMEHRANRYKIYPTENIYILIKLDIQTGRL